MDWVQAEKSLAKLCTFVDSTAGLYNSLDCTGPLSKLLYHVFMPLICIVLSVIVVILPLYYYHILHAVKLTRSF